MKSGGPKGQHTFCCFQKGMPMMPPAHALRASNNIDMQGISRGFVQSTEGCAVDLL